MNEKNIMYFIASHTHELSNGHRDFIWPILPDPEMGEELCNKIKEEHEIIRKWIVENPDKVLLAINGYYLKKIDKCTWLGACSSHRIYSIATCYGHGEHPPCYAGCGVEGHKGVI